MEYTVRVKVLGVKFFEGEIDGEQFDTGTIFVEEKLDDRRGNAKGYAGMAYGLESSKSAKAIIRNEFPLVCELLMENRTSGKTTKPVVLEVRPQARIDRQTGEIKEAVKARA